MSASVPYDRTALTTAVVHLGLGAFSRAHVCAYLDDLAVAGVRDVGVLGTSMTSERVPAALAETAATADVVMVSGITLAVLDDPQRTSLIEVLAHAATHGTRVVLDPNVRPRLWGSTEEAARWVDAAVGAASMVLASTQDLGVLDVVAAEWATRVAELVVTDGAAPSRWWAGSAAGTVRVEPVGAVDTTGAGDAFDAAYVLARAEGATVPEAVTAGHAAARDAVGHPGGLRWPDRP